MLPINGDTPRLARVSDDELVLIAYYRTLTPDLKQSTLSFMATASKRSASGAPQSGTNIVPMIGKRAG